jgi:UDP-N-acetylmuramate: L-alanyl-gamma-D-glutamyl-meso-diaminopimelate ligase
LSEAIGRKGRRAGHFGAIDEILSTMLAEAKSGDVLLVMSNGAFGGLVSKLKAGLESRG